MPIVLGSLGVSGFLCGAVVVMLRLQEVEVLLLLLTFCSLIQSSGLYCPGTTCLASVGGDPCWRPGVPGWLQSLLSKSLSAFSGAFTRENPAHYIST